MSTTSRTRWGGIADRKRQAPGFFRVQQIDGVWWLVDPDGGLFLSKGVNTVRFDQDQIRGTNRIPYADACRHKYGTPAAWREAIARRLRSWGFNSLGAWSDDAIAELEELPLSRAPIINLGARLLSYQQQRHPDWGVSVFPEIFDHELDSFMRRHANECCAGSRNDPSVIGWFSDNEMHWGPDFGGREELLTLFLNRQPGSPGRRAAIAFLQSRYESFEAFAAVWKNTASAWDGLASARVEQPFSAAAEPGRPSSADRRRAAFESDCEAFSGLVAERYFAATVAAIKAADPNHLALGCRFAVPPRLSVIEAAGRNLDVLSFNCYDTDPSHDLDVYAVAARPCLIGEFAFRGEDSGLPNTKGGGPRVATQAERARNFTRYLTTALQRPEIVGYHWFEHADQPAEGRFDGEDSNFGIVTIDDDAYVELAAAMTALNAQAEGLHGSSAVGLSRKQTMVADAATVATGSRRDRSEHR